MTVLQFVFNMCCVGSQTLNSQPHLVKLFGDPELQRQSKYIDALRRTQILALYSMTTPCPTHSLDARTKGYLELPLPSTSCSRCLEYGNWVKPTVAPADRARQRIMLLELGGFYEDLKKSSGVGAGPPPRAFCDGFGYKDLYWRLPCTSAHQHRPLLLHSSS